MIAVFLFLFGLLPWVDNYAHLFGFISGTLKMRYKITRYLVTLRHGDSIETGECVNGEPCVSVSQVQTVPKVSQCDQENARRNLTPFTNINDILGILLSFALLPYIVFGEFDHGRKFYQAIFAIMIWLALMITLIVLFYNPNPLYLEWAHRFTCVPPIGEAEGKTNCPKHSDEQVFSDFSIFSELTSLTLNSHTSSGEKCVEIVKTCKIFPFWFCRTSWKCDC